MPPLYTRAISGVYDTAASGVSVGRRGDGGRLEIVVGERREALGCVRRYDFECESCGLQLDPTFEITEHERMAGHLPVPSR